MKWQKSPGSGWANCIVLAALHCGFAGFELFCLLPRSIWSHGSSMQVHPWLLEKNKNQKPLPEIDRGEGRREGTSASYSLSPGSNYQPGKKLRALRSFQHLPVCVQPLQLPSCSPRAVGTRGDSRGGPGPPRSPETSPSMGPVAWRAPRSLTPFCHLSLGSKGRRARWMQELLDTSILIS